MEEVTPDDLLDQLHIEFNFGLDLAADANNAKCAFYFDEEANALEQDWIVEDDKDAWCNPPYGRGIIKWITKATEETEKHGTCIVMLLPSRTDTAWFRRVVETADEVRFFKGRLQFEGQASRAPFPSCLVIWYGNHHTRIHPTPEGAYEYNLIWRK